MRHVLLDVNVVVGLHSNRLPITKRTTSIHETPNNLQSQAANMQHGRIAANRLAARRIPWLSHGRLPRFELAQG